MKYCCEAMDESVDDGFVLFSNYVFSIRGEPDLRDDGDGFVDDMSGEKNISFCPHCGTKLIP